MNVIEIVVRGRDEGLGSSVDDVDRKAKGLKGTLMDVGKVAAGFLTGTVLMGAGQKALEFFGDATDSASDLNEALNKSNTVFGSSGSAIERWATDAAGNIGLAKGAALDAAGSFGNMFSQLGFGQSTAADMSMTMGDLAADFASFHNADITEVLDAQSAAFRGEYDSVQRFLPLINAANVEQKAMEQTGKASADQLTAQEKALATYTLMLEGAGDAQGDFARTADDQANAERIAAAEMENMQAQIGQKLLPVTRKLTELKLTLARVFMEKVVPAAQKVWEWVQEKLVPALRDLGGWISRNVLPVLSTLGRFIVGTILPALGDFVEWLGRNKDTLAAVAIGILGALVPAFVAWAVAAGAAAIATIAAAAPFILLAAAIAAFALLVINHWDTIKAATLAVFNFIKDTISGVISWVANNWPLLLAILTGPIGLAVYFIVQHWETIKNGVTAVKDWIVEKFNAVKDFIGGLPGKFAEAARGLWDWITSGISAAVGWAIERINDLIRAYNRIPVAPDIPTIGGGKSGGVARKAAGGPGGGWTIVGERGPELVRLPSGSGISPAANSEIASRRGGGEPIVIHSHVYLDGKVIHESEQRIVRTEFGGDAQAAFGWTV